MTQQLAKFNLLGLTYTYRQLSTDELAAYVAFAESEHGRRYHDVMMKSLQEALVVASIRMAWRMGKLLKLKAG
ncbi:MAG: hypothetical protein BMS9Abin26_1181 [Gammaproteobacteria bacterium]|nr:MAG: hypothetical protein BMS9Abin26_1181 [Gammaproteobacteria bacterium]